MRGITRVRRDGVDGWLYPDGSWLPVIAGGDETEEEKAAREAREQQEREERESRERESSEPSLDDLPPAIRTLVLNQREAERKAKREAETAKAEAERYRQEQAQREDSERTELEKAQARTAELERQNEEATAAVRRSRLMVELSKPDHGIASDAVDVVAGLVDVEYDDGGTPQGVKEAVESLLEQRPSLRRQATPPSDNTSPAAPGGGRDRGGGISKEEALRMARENPDELNRLIDEGKVPASIFGG